MIKESEGKNLKNHLEFITNNIWPNKGDYTNFTGKIKTDILSEQEDIGDLHDRLGIIDGEAGRTEDETYSQGDGKPFTPLEAKILKALHQHLNQDELEQLTNEAPETYKGGSGEKFWNVMKLFGINWSNDLEKDTRISKYAKWALDNWTEEGDYANIENPIKVPLKWYEVDKSETGSQIEYKDGYAEVLGFDEEDAED